MTTGVIHTSPGSVGKWLAIVIGCIALFWIAANIRVHAAPVLDFLIRNQAPIVSLIGVLVGVGVVAFGIGRLQEGALGPPVRNLDGVVRVMTLPDLRRFLIPAAVAMLFFAGIGASRPIPPATGLELPTPLRDDSSNRQLLLFIHGWNGDPQGTWRQFPDLVVSDSQYDDFNVWAIQYPTFMIRRNLSIGQLADFITKYMEAQSHTFDRYSKVVVIAHSMGGLVAREIAIQEALRGRQPSFTKVIEVSTPHQGASPAKLTATLGISRELTADMEPGSDFLRDLETHWNALRSPPPTFCIGSPHDEVVPSESATAYCTDATHYAQGGHREVVKPESHTDVRYVIPMGQVR
jgi:hypothetical protein